MSRNTNHNDEKLLSQLRNALGQTDPVPSDVIEFAKAAFAWRSIDAELAQIAYDSSTEELPAGVRSTATARMLSFEAGRWTIDIEYNESTQRLIGQVEPGREVSIELHEVGGIRGTATDELGRFEYYNTRPGPISLVIRTSGDLEIIKTEWTVL